MAIRNTLIVLLAWGCFEGEFVEYIKITESPTIFHRSGRIYVNFLAPYSNPSAKIGCSSLIRSLVSLVPKPHVNLLARKPLVVTSTVDVPLLTLLKFPRNDAILIKLRSFIKTTDYAVFLGIAEDINIQIMEIVKSAGASFALPGRAIYMEGDKA